MNILALARDFIKDVVFLDENNTEMSLAKETIRSGGALDQNALIGIGGKTSTGTESEKTNVKQSDKC